VVKMATKIHEARTDLLTADHLRGVHRLLASRRVFKLVEAKLEAEPAPVARAIPA
jgi:hypothetical protein